MSIEQQAIQCAPSADESLRSEGYERDFSLYQGNSVFRNQPSYNIFNKSIECVNDSLYAHLNAVDLEILQNEQAHSKMFGSYTHGLALKDPRTKEPIRQTVRDYTSADENDQHLLVFPNIHDGERHSTLSRDQQAACLRVLLAGQNCQPLPEEDFIIWRATESKRCTEHQVVQKYIFDYSQDQKEMLYRPMKPLVKAYQKWFQLKIHQVLSNRASDEFWVTSTGLPQLSQCKNDQTRVKLEGVHLNKINGDLKYWSEGIKLERDDLRSLNIRLERYATPTQGPHNHLMDMEDYCDYFDEGNLFVLPLESLLMLLTPSAAYVDLPTEMFIDIKEIDEQKLIEFDIPLPPHHCGWHTNNFIIDRAYEAYMSQPGQSQWIQMGDVMSKESVKKSNACCGGNYKIHEIDTDYSSKEPTKTNQALISWCLSDSSSSSSLKILTQMSVSGSSDPKGQHLLACHHLKLENKPHCGLEIMTKNELLKIWLQLQLLQKDQGHCSRISLVNFEPLLEEELTLSSVEQQLHEYYNTSMDNLLANLFEFLKLLIGLPQDEYLLRYSSKYKDKFLLCRKTQEKIPQSFSLNELLQKELSLPSEHSFLTQSNSYLPISTKLCGPLHLFNQMLPCAFPPKKNGKCARINKNAEKPRTARIARFEMATEKRRAAISLQRRQHKSQQKARSRARKREATKKEVEEQKQLDKILNL